MIIKIFPKSLWPIVAPIVCLPNQYHYWRASRHLTPIIKQRITDMNRKQKDPNFDYEPPNDFITWSVQLALKSGKPDELTPKLLSLRYMTTNFAAIHTTALTSTNVLLDLAHSPPAVLDSIREEVTRLWHEAGGTWTKQSYGRMWRVDSAIRESIRLHNFVNWGLTRKVMQDVTMPDGTVLPKGSNVSVPAYSMHRHGDPALVDAATYDALRYSRPRETMEAQLSGDAGEKGADWNTRVLQHKNLSAVTTGENYLQFGHGKHACPGRFFAVQEVKTLVAHLVMNYEIEHLAERPDGLWMGDMTLPPMQASIKVKRKAHT
jgi:cytochrome P450